MEELRPERRKTCPIVSAHVVSKQLQPEQTTSPQRARSRENAIRSGRRRWACSGARGHAEPGHLGKGEVAARRPVGELFVSTSLSTLDLNEGLRY